MDLLNLKEHLPEEYPGKVIRINSQEYIIGHLVGEGGYKLVYQLINARSGLCHYVLRIPLAAGITKHNDMGPYRGMHCYDYYRWLAKMTYRYDGYNEKGSLPIFADFLDLKEFAHLDNEYCGIFNVVEEFVGGFRHFSSSKGCQNDSRRSTGKKRACLSALSIYGNRFGQWQENRNYGAQ